MNWLYGKPIDFQFRRFKLLLAPLFLLSFLIMFLKMFKCILHLSVRRDQAPTEPCTRVHPDKVVRHHRASTKPCEPRPCTCIPKLCAAIVARPSHANRNRAHSHRTVHHDHAPTEP